MTSPTPPAAWASLQGHYAGAVSRLAAYAIDLAVSSGLFTLALAAITYVVNLLTGQSLTPARWPAPLAGTNPPASSASR